MPTEKSNSVIKVNFLTTDHMAKEKRPNLMDGSTRAYSRGVKKVLAANRCDSMVVYTRVISKTTSFTVVVS